MAKVSIIMPSLNVEKYIRQCVDSVLQQTLCDIEVIFVDAGSTDGTLEILEDYTRNDPRTRLLISEKKSYGYQVNLGFDAATGEYLGIIETDDYADPEMFEKLYNCAIEYDADVVKSGFYYYYSTGKEKNVPEPIASDAMASWTFCPVTDFKAPLEQAEFFNIKPTIWSAVYKQSFIRENGIRLNETPGASYQDASFNFMVWACAKRVRLLPDCFLHYRQDNENSSINSSGKVYCICDEYEKMESFLAERPYLKGCLDPILSRIKYDSYNWNYDRLSGDNQKIFFERFYKEMSEMNFDGRFRKEHFESWRWNNLMLLIEDPSEFLLKTKCESLSIPYRPDPNKRKNRTVSQNIKQDRSNLSKYQGTAGKIRSIFDTALWSLRSKGVIGTMRYFKNLAVKRIRK